MGRPERLLEPEGDDVMATGTRSTESNGRLIDEREREAIGSELDALRTEVSRLAELLGDIAGNRYASLREQASGLAEDVAHRGAVLRDEAFARAGALEEELQRTVRQRPLTAVAIAAGVGYLVGLLSRSHR